jgi:phage shock protein C
MIGGVCNGLADYFETDPSLIRILFVIMAFAGGIGILLYFILLLAIPEKPIDLSVFAQTTSTPSGDQTSGGGSSYNPEPPREDPYRNQRNYNRNRGNLIGGLVLITLGALFLADEFIPHVSFGDLWPIILVVIGIGLLINSIAGKKRDY